MKYFLIIGLMMAGSFAQADICIPLWWSSATTFQVELEAESKGSSAMNKPCDGSGKTPMELALENNENPAVFSAIVKHFELNRETRYQATRMALRRTREAYRDQSSSAEKAIGPIDEPPTPTISSLIDKDPFIQINNRELLNINIRDNDLNTINTYIEKPDYNEFFESEPLDNHKEDLERYRARLAIYETLSAA